MSGETLLRIPYVDHPGQALVAASNARIRVIAAGVRWGKTLFAVVELIREHGRRQKDNFRAWSVAPTYSLAMEMSRHFLEIVPEEIVAGVNKDEHRVSLIDGSIIEWKSAEEPERLRGAGLDFLVVDEAALCDDLSWKKLRTRTISEKGRILLIGTPLGKNWFYDVWQRGQDPEAIAAGTHESWQFTSWDNPYLDAAEINAASDDLGTEAMQEQELRAQFVDNLGQVFRNIKICATGNIEEPGRGQYVIGWDLAKTEDYTVAFVLDLRRRAIVAWDRHRRLDWSIQKARLTALAQKWNALVIMDSSGLGDPIYEDLRNQGLRIKGIDITTSTKPHLVTNLAMLLEQRAVSYPAIPELLAELAFFSTEKLPSGYIRYGAPEGKHDDCVTALMLAVSALRQGALSIPTAFTRERRIEAA